LIAFSIPILAVFNNPLILKEISHFAPEKRIGRTDIFRPFKTNFLISGDHFMPTPAQPANSEGGEPMGQDPIGLIKGGGQNFSTVLP
jgi:hypothetical protein